MCQNGATHRELARAIGISEDTLYKWMSRHVEFGSACKVGKFIADSRVEGSLYARAVGYSYDSEKIFKNGDEVIRAPIVEHVPPDVGACIFWLKNRRKELWRDKIDHEHTGQGGKPLGDDMSDRELARRILLVLDGEKAEDEKPSENESVH